MGLLDIFKSKETKKQMRYAKMLNNSVPIFSQFGDNIYASDVVQQALYSIVTEMVKLNPTHIRTKGFDPIPVEDSNVQWVLDNPNELMTTGEFIEKFMWNLLLHYNSFIYMQYDNVGDLIGLYPLSPTSVTFLEDATGSFYLKMLFKTGFETTLPYKSLIHLRSHFSKDDLMGGNEMGQPDHQPLLETLGLNHTLLQGVKKALNASFAINGIVKYNTMLDDGSMEQNILEFENKLKNSQSGMLGIDMKNEVIQFKRDLKIVDEATLKFIDDKVLRNFGTPIEIVRGKYTVEEYEAFYQKTIEPFVITISQAFTKGLFTTRQKGFRNKVKFYPKELVFMSMAQKLEMVNLMGQSGSIWENEKRVAFGYAPDPALVGVRMQSLNYVNVDFAKDYQMGGQSAQQNTPVGNDPAVKEDGEEDVKGGAKDEEEQQTEIGK